MPDATGVPAEAAIAGVDPALVVAAWTSCGLALVDVETAADVICNGVLTTPDGVMIL